ncbi:MAG: plasmid pRiA4b ORF-3 family protein [Alphaproteobacteria bacterium]
MIDTIVRLKIILADTEPPIWRRVEVPADLTLKDLHALIQAVMRWTNSHLYLYQVGRETIAGPGMGGVGFGAAPAVGAGRVSLADLAEGGIKRFRYVYDMGDSWEHDIRIEKVLAGGTSVAYPRFIDGAMRAPPDDSGGIPGFYDFLDAINDAEHPEHADRIEWYGGAFDPDDIEADRIHRDLARLAARRKRGTAKRASKPA